MKLLNGEIVLSQRPTHRQLKKLAGEGFTDVVTLLGNLESPETIANTVKHTSMEWTWLPISFYDKDLHPYASPERMAVLVKKLIRKLEEGRKIFLHCAAGIDRTGIVIYTLLVALG